MIVCLAPLALGACASMRDVSMPIVDPEEASNRQVLAINQAVLHPIAQVVKAVTPGPIHDRLIDLDSNLQEPRIFVNDVLQGRPEAAFHTLVRFIANSTIGIGGLFDFAAMNGLPQETGDFGETLFVWGGDAGIYTVTPFFGPSTSRDVVGLAVDTAADPISLFLGLKFGTLVGLAPGVVDGVARISQLKEAEDASIDFYTFLRSSYYQTRRAQLRQAIGLPAEVDSPATALPK